MRHLSWIITIPVALLAVSFAVSNRESVELTIWPLPFALSAPVYILFLGALAVGFVVGGIVVWLAQHRHRRDARRHAARVRELSAEVKRYRERDVQAREEKTRLEEAARREAAIRAGTEAAQLERPAATGVPR